MAYIDIPFARCSPISLSRSRALCWISLANKERWETALKKIALPALVAGGMLAFGFVGHASANCGFGQLRSYCADGTYRCCRPAGTIDCGNGYSCRIGTRCAGPGRCVSNHIDTDRDRRRN